MKASKVDPARGKTVTVIAMVLIALTVVVLSPRSKASSAADPHADIVPNEVVVEIRSGASIEAVNARNNTLTKRPMNGTNFYLLKIPHGASARKWQKRLSADPDVIKAYLNPAVSSPLVLSGRRTLSFPSNHAIPGYGPADYHGQNGLDKLRLEQAHMLSEGKNVVVAVIDTGLDLQHPALANNLWTNGYEVPGDGIDNDGDGYIDDYYGWNFIDNNNDPSEQRPDNPKHSIGGHGTFIAGLIVLVAPQARIMAIKAFQPDGKSDAFTVAAAVKFAADHGANVINLSFGAPVVSSVLADAIADAKMRCVVMAAAVGNDNTELPQFPASSTDVVGVAAVDADDTKAPFSNYGADVSVAAPGVDLISTYPGGGYAKWSGTSFATPLASAEGALLFGADSLVGDLEGIIKDTADSIDNVNPEFQGKLGSGRIDPLGALESLYVGPGIRLPRDVYSQIKLTRGASEHSAGGIAEVAAYASSQELDLEIQSLTPRSNYKLVINGVEIQDLVADNMGSLALSLSSDPSGSDSPLPGQLQPITKIQHVELQDDRGRVILQGDYAPLGAGSYPAAQTVEKEAYLSPVIPQTPGGGRATLEITSDRTELVIVAGGIADSSCAISIDGVSGGWARTQDGYMKLDLSSDGSTGNWVPGTLQPYIGIKHVEVRARSGQVVLAGDFKF
jgi:subtilisin family serine protease